MRQAHQKPDWGLLLALAFSLITAFPFLAYPTLPHTNASENYVYRAADTAAALIEGRLYPRWSPHALNGYGAPIPHYYAPGAPYLAALIQVLFTDDAVSAVRLVFVISLALASVATYRLVARRIHEAAGLLAAFLYLGIPYVGLTIPHALGDPAQALALGLLPLLLWSADRLFRANCPLDLGLNALAITALMLTQPDMLITGLALALTFSLGAHEPGWQTRLRRLTVSAGLGIGMASFYWLPALLEVDAVHWLPPAIPVDYRLTLAELFQAAEPIDPARLKLVPQFTVGPLVLVFVLGGAALSITNRRAKLPFLALAAGTALIAVGLLAMPRRTDLVGPISLCLAVAGSSAIDWRECLPLRWRRLALPALLIVVWISSRPVWIVPFNDQGFGGVSPADQIQYQQLGYSAAVLPPHLPTPSSLIAGVAANRQLVEGYLSGSINRVALDRPEIGVQIGILESQSHSALFQVRADSPVAFTLLTAYFPGWRAALGGRDVPLFADPQTGLIRIELPIIRGGELRIVLDATPVRTGAWIISAAALAGALVLTWGRLRQRSPQFEDSDRLTLPERRLLAALCICMAGATWAVNMAGEAALLRPRPGFGLEQTRLLQTRTDAGLGVLAYRLNADTLHPGDHLELSLLWQAQRAISQNYQALVYLLNTSDGTRWAEVNYHHPGGYPTRRWLPYRYIQQDYDLALPADMPPGNYQVTIEVAGCTPVCSPRNRLTFFDASGQMLGPVLYLPTILAVQR